jgi:antirestriction protein
MKNSKNTPKIYVGTYGMYNSGSLFGKWFDLSDYSDAQEFYKDCYEYHRNESESSGSRPELMFQDWEYLPSFLISESSLHQDTFKYFEAVSEMDDDRAEAFEIYCSDIVSYQGYFGRVMKDPKTEFTYQYVVYTGMLSGAPEILEKYFDYEAFGRDLFIESYAEINEFIFID